MVLLEILQEEGSRHQAESRCMRSRHPQVRSHVQSLGTWPPLKATFSLQSQGRGGRIQGDFQQDDWGQSH